MEKELTEAVFNISPTKVYGVTFMLLLSLIFGFIWLGKFVYSKIEKQNEKRESERKEREEKAEKERTTLQADNKAQQEKLTNALIEVVQANTKAFENMQREAQQVASSQIAVIEAVKTLEQTTQRLKEKLVA